MPHHSPADPHGKPSLVLEAAVLANGLTYASLPTPTKTALSKSSSSAIKLLDIEAVWYRPLPTLGLHTTPGINYCNTLQLPVSDFIIRWSIAWIDQEGRKGSLVSASDAWVKYLADPAPTYPPTLIPFSLIVATSNNPILVNPTSGNSHTSANVALSQARLQSNIDQESIIVTRKGQKVFLKSRVSNKKVVLPKPSGRPKYSTDPLPQFKLDASAFPPGTPQPLMDSAIRAFAASVSTSTLSTYKTALGHLEKAEAILGHTFSSPPTEQEIIYFTAYLAQREVAKSTIQSYLSAVRYISLSRGASHHTKIPELSTQILAGAANIKKDARIEAEKPKRRPITLNMLILLKHAIATHRSWSDYEKSLRWSCMLLGYWGSFRMGELLQTEKSKFHPGSSLIPSDIKFQEDSVAVWLRSPKVWKEGGDVVEVWSVEENPQLDPVIALKHYMGLRSCLLGPAEEYPVFLHENGSLFTKAELNKDIKFLLSVYPDISSTRDLWSGHSFRAGISTLLTSLGFTEDQIKKWGRWSSMAYMAYVQDQTKRRQTRKQITGVFSLMLAAI